MCHMCHLLPTPTATATDPPPSNSTTMHSRLVHQDRTQKNQKTNFKIKEIVKALKKKWGFLGLQF